MSARRSAARSSFSISSRKLAIEPLESRRLLAGDFELLKDINRAPAPEGIFGLPPGIGGGGSLQIGNTYFFTPLDGVHGQELWKSDGTAEGTVLVKDIRTGKEHSYPSYFSELNGILYFAANDGVHGPELWRSDGTEEGTYLVRDALPGKFGSSPANLRSVNGTLVFEATTAGADRRLWRSNGTAEGTVQFAQAMSKYPSILGRNSTSIFFKVDEELWRTDGTDAGTIRLLAGGGFIAATGSVGEDFYFSRGSHSTPIALWKTDGTLVGTTLVAATRPWSPGSGIRAGIEFGDVMLFAATDPVHGIELWKTDGTAGGTTLVKDIHPGVQPSSNAPLSSMPQNFVRANGAVYFAVEDPLQSSKLELWKSDGTTEGTMRVFRVPATDGTVLAISQVAGDGTVFFTVRDNDGNSLWRTDGSEAGAVKIKRINDNNGAGAAFGRGSGGVVANLGGIYLMTVDDQNHGWELWTTDGAEAGTGLLKDIHAATLDANVARQTEVGALTYFTANDGVHGEELWVSDGTGGGTRLVKDLLPGAEGAKIDHLVNVDGTLYFTAGNNLASGGLWKTDGTEAGTVLVREFASPKFHTGTRTFANVGGTLFFSMDVDSGAELWKSNGTDVGTTRVVFLAAASNRAMTEMTNVNGVLFFAANSSAGRELWKSDGTEAGTVLVKNIYPGGDYWFGPNSSNPKELTEFNGQLYFAARSSLLESHLWRSDGTAAGTIQVAFGESARPIRFPVEINNLNGTLYFIAETALWKDDGSLTGPVMIGDLRTNGSMGSSQSMTRVGNRLFIVDHLSVSESVLWTSDGTAAGTIRLGEGVFSRPNNPIAWNGKLYFMAETVGTGMELWRSDGTVAGTMLVKDFDDEWSSSLDPANRMAVVNGRLVVIAKAGVYGNEMWVAEPDVPQLTGDYNGDGRVDGGDFLAWQRGFGGSATPAGSGADGDASGTIDAGDLAVWKEQFGDGASTGAIPDPIVVAGKANMPIAMMAAESAAFAFSLPLEEMLSEPRAVGAPDLIAIAQGAFRSDDGRTNVGAMKIHGRTIRTEESPIARRATTTPHDGAFDLIATTPREIMREWAAEEKGFDDNPTSVARDRAGASTRPARALKRQQHRRDD